MLALLGGGVGLVLSAAATTILVRLATLWFAVAIGGESFAIVDAFPDEQGRQAHLDGAVAAALFAKADELLEVQPEIEYVDVLAAKLPDGDR